MLAGYIQIQEIKDDQEVLEVEAEAQYPLLKEDRVEHQRLVKVLEEEMVETLPLVEVILQVVARDIKQEAVAALVPEVKIYKM
jgi:arginine deiminase